MPGITKAAVVIGAGVAAFSVDAADVRMHPLEAYWVKYNYQGMMEGEVIEQCRNWCNERVETRHLKLSLGGLNQLQDERIIAVGEDIYNVDERQGTVTKTKNPMWSGIVEQVEAGGAESTFDAWMNAMGFHPTGSTRTIAGEACDDYVSQQMMNANSCITKDGLTLRSEVAGAIQSAVEVHRGDPGDLAAYEIPAEAPTEEEVATSVEELQKMIEALKKQVPQ
jgi:hypothetical protein